MIQRRGEGRTQRQRFVSIITVNTSCISLPPFLIRTEVWNWTSPRDWRTLLCKRCNIDMWSSLQDGAVGRECLSAGKFLLRPLWRSSSGQCWALVCHTLKSGPSRSEITSMSHGCLMGWSAFCCAPKQQTKEGRKIPKTFIYSPLCNCIMTAMSKKVICFSH